MSTSLTITPGRQLQVADDPDSLPLISDTALTALETAFAQSSAAGLLRLASHELDEELPAVLVFWRGLARRLFQAVCQLGEGAIDRWATVAAPPDEQLSELVAEAPPMRGLEYLNVELLRGLWHELRELVAVEARRHAQGPAGFLRHVNPLWHLLGRVTFHLAENKRDPQRPFAFLATYTHKLSGQTRLQHLPLAEALKSYASANERAKLESLLEPVRRAAQQSGLVRELLDTKALFAPQAWTVRQAYRFLTESQRIEDSGVVVRVPDWWSARRPPRPQVQVQLGTKPASALAMDSLLDFQVAIALDGESLTEDERRQLLAGTEGLVLLRGKWVEVDRQQLQQALDHWKQLERQHPDGISFVEGMRLLAGAKLGAEDAAEEHVISWSRITAGDWLRQTLDRIRQPESDDACQPGRDLRATLRPYQVDGVRWLWFMTELGLGACLADDMGLGKTIQVIDLLQQRRRVFEEQKHNARPSTGRRSRPEQVCAVPAQHESSAGTAKTSSGLPETALPSLLIVPASLIGNWRQELARFAPTLRVFFAHRSECDADDLARVACDPRGKLAGFDLVISTYGLARRQEWLEQLQWSLVVLDEAQAIKNASSAQTRGVKKLKAAGRIVLTGTPVENHLGDLWSLFDFCCPGLLGTAVQFKQFVKQLNKRQDAQAFGSLRRLVRPYILRRLKTDPTIVPDLPEKTEMRTECGLSKKQAALYEQAVADLAKRLETAEGIARRGLVLAVLMQLKQICNHPAQYLAGTSYSEKDSGKFDRLKLLCEPIAERQEKVLVFTQFQTITQPLAEFLATVFGRPGLVLHGGTPVAKRSELVRRFQDGQGPPFFVISLKAGGSGLNLTAASHVVHFDRWWNPAVENQATDRAFRIGQKRNVLVHKFVCRGTVEERIDKMIHDKQAVADQILNQESEAVLTEMSDDELLRFVALDIGRATMEE
jgi:non-specific serine/threonine protein kinase